MSDTSIHVTNTRWEANPDGDVIRVGSNDPAWRTVTLSTEELQSPIPAWKIANMLTDAFRQGIKAKEQHLRETLGISESAASRN